MFSTCCSSFLLLQIKSVSRKRKKIIIFNIFNKFKVEDICNFILVILHFGPIVYFLIMCLTFSSHSHLSCFCCRFSSATTSLNSFNHSFKSSIRSQLTSCSNSPMCGDLKMKKWINLDGRKYSLM